MTAEEWALVQSFGRLLIIAGTCLSKDPRKVRELLPFQDRAQCPVCMTMKRLGQDGRIVKHKRWQNTIEGNQLISSVACSGSWKRPTQMRFNLVVTTRPTEV